MTTPKSLFSFPSGEDCYEINTADWVMVSCLNGRTTFQLKTKEFTIDGGKIVKICNEHDPNFFLIGLPYEIYCMRAIITSVLYIFYPISHCSLYCKAVSIRDNLCIKQENSSIFGAKIRSL